MKNEKKPYNGWLFLTVFSLFIGYEMGLSISFQIFFGILDITEKNLSRTLANKLINLYSSHSYLIGIFTALLLWMFVVCIKLVLENNKIRKKINY